MQTSRNFLVRYRWWVILLLLGGLGAWYVLRTPAAPAYETTAVTRGDVLQRVSVTGRIESDNEVELAFERSGKVIGTPKPVGVRVREGETLIRLESSELSALRAQAQANLDYEIVKLAELKKGTRAEDIQVSESRVQSAKQAVIDADRGVRSALSDAYTKSDDAIRNKADVLFRNPRTANPELKATLNDDRVQTALPQTRVAVEGVLVNWATTHSSLFVADDISGYAMSVEGWLTTLKTYLDSLSLAVNGMIPNAQIAQSTIDEWRGNVFTARTNINTTYSAVVAADEKYRAAQSALSVAQNELALKRAAATPETIAAQEARVASSRASVVNYDAQLSKHTLRAPFAGVVTKQSAKPGQSIAANAVLMTVMSDGVYKVEANIPEVDVAKISLADVAEAYLDAYGADVRFPLTVTAIDPAETIIEGVPTYKVTLHFATKDERIRSGMTANIDIATDERRGVLAIPARAVATKEGKKIVRVLAGIEPVERIITTGLRGSDGHIEVLEGLTEGERVIVFDGTVAK